MTLNNYKLTHVSLFNSSDNIQTCNCLIVTIAGEYKEDNIVYKIVIFNES